MNWRNKSGSSSSRNRNSRTAEQKNRVLLFPVPPDNWKNQVLPFSVPPRHHW